MYLKNETTFCRGNMKRTVRLLLLLFLLPDVEFLSKNLLEREGRDIFWLRPSDVCACPVFCSMLSNAHYFMVESLNPGSDNFKTSQSQTKTTRQISPPTRDGEIFFSKKLRKIVFLKKISSKSSLFI